MARGWQVAYDVSGSLFTTRARVRDTLVHEVFHLNDFAHGADHGAWSDRALKAIYRTITSTCGVAAAFAEGPKKTDRLRALTTCLAPYAPDSIVVVGGTTYAFMPDNGVKEYAADLAKRYFLEETAARAHRRLRPWKCQTPQNGMAWQLLVAEFFGGVDSTGPCA